jgi:hypothetical protein
VLGFSDLRREVIIDALLGAPFEERLETNRGGLKCRLARLLAKEEVLAHMRLGQPAYFGLSTLDPPQEWVELRLIARNSRWRTACYLTVQKKVSNRQFQFV